MKKVYEKIGDMIFENSYGGDAKPPADAVILDESFPEVQAYLAEKQTQLATAKKIALQQELDRRLAQATGVAQSLEYAATRNPLSNANTARLNAYHSYIDALIALEYTDPPIWPTSPDT